MASDIGPDRPPPELADVADVFKDLKMSHSGSVGGDGITGICGLGSVPGAATASPLTSPPLTRASFAAPPAPPPPSASAPASAPKKWSPLAS